MKKSYHADEKGYYGVFGGSFVPEMLYPNMETLQRSYLNIMNDECKLDIIFINNELDKKFWARADQFINLANEQSQEVGPGEVSSSLLFAAARFNAFVAAATARDIDELKKNKEDAIRGI